MGHMADMRRRENGIGHRPTKAKRPRTNARVERMNRTIKKATVKRFHDDDHARFEAHLARIQFRSPLEDPTRPNPIPIHP